MIQFHVFPGAVKRVVTFSYDDGSEKDARLIELFNRYGVKGTFHLNGNKYIGATDAEKQALRERYHGHEVACHTVTHGWPARMPVQSVVGETYEDRKILEGVFGYPVVGMSYPSGSFDEKSIAAMQACGILYSRTTKDTLYFPLPTDFMLWHPTAHHKKAQEPAERFLRELDSQWTHPLLYIWGHSHEFKTEQDWQAMETLVATVAGNDKIWYATNIEIYNYMTAQRMLQISADETMFYNSTALTLYVERDKKEIIEIPAGPTVYAPRGENE